MSWRTHRLLLAPLACALALACDGSISERSLLANERFWPYHVALTRPWQPAAGEASLVPGVAGVLIRVEENGHARIDFGRDGLHEVPVGYTDLVANAERIRRGQLDKDTANFLLEIGPRLASSASPRLEPFGLRAAGEYEAFLCVFAKPHAPGFDDLVAALGPLREQAGVLTVLFPQGEQPDRPLREQLRALGWTVPFVFDHLSEPYTRSLLPEGAAFPFLLLVSREGRLRYQGRYEGSLPPALTAALAAVESR